MLLTTGNLVSYILQRTWFSKFSDLEFFQNQTNLSNIKITGLYINNPRNNIFKCEIGDRKSFIFKQPKYLTSGSTWLIYKENEFYRHYKKNNNSLLPSFSWFDKHYHILVLPYLTPFQISFPKKNLDEIKIEVQSLAQMLGEKLAFFHNSLKINPSSKNSFIRNTASFSTPYQELMKTLRLGYKRAEFLNETLFINWSDTQHKIQMYELLWDKSFFDVLEDFSQEWVQQSRFLIHGDLKIENLLWEKKELKFIDFEMVSVGDNAWDMACLAHSILHKSPFKFKITPEIRFNFFKCLLQTYLKFNPENERLFLGRVYKFWAMRKVERYRELVDPTEFYFDSNIILKLLNNTTQNIMAFEKGYTTKLSSKVNDTLFNYL